MKVMNWEVSTYWIIPVTVELTSCIYLEYLDTQKYMFLVHLLSDIDPGDTIALVDLNGPKAYLFLIFSQTFLRDFIQLSHPHILYDLKLNWYIKTLSRKEQNHLSNTKIKANMYCQFISLECS